MSDGFEVVGIHLNEVSITILGVVGLLAAIFILRVIFSKTPMTRVMPDSSFLVIISTIIGIILYFTEADLGFIKFDYNIFILLLIPPIIFDSGYFLQKDFFFKNIAEIIIFAVFGTLFNSLMVSGVLFAFTDSYKVPLTFPQVLTFEALTSAVDPVAVIAVFDDVHVNETLYTITFGESVLNDAVCIVLYNVFSSLEGIIQEEGNSSSVQAKMAYLAIAKFLYVFIGGILVGAIVTIILTILAKFVGRVSYIEIFIPFIIGVTSYVVADVLLMSGIMSILVSGIMLARYNEPNMHIRVRSAFRIALKSLASVSESVVFVLLGLSTAESIGTAANTNTIDGLFIVLTIIVNIACRFVITFAFTGLLNLGRRKKGRRIPIRDQTILAYGGLRGAIAFALSYSLPTDNGYFPADVKSELLSSILIFIFVTIFVIGMTIKPLLKAMNVKKSKDEGADNLFISNEDADAPQNVKAKKEKKGKKTEKIKNEKKKKEKKKNNRKDVMYNAHIAGAEEIMLSKKIGSSAKNPHGTIDIEMVDSEDKSSYDTKYDSSSSRPADNTGSKSSSSVSSSFDSEMLEKEDLDDKVDKKQTKEKEKKELKKKSKDVTKENDSASNRFEGNNADDLQIADSVTSNLMKLSELTIKEVLSCAVVGFKAVSKNTKQENRAMKFINKFDRFLQRICLKELLPEQKELLDKLNEIQEDVMHEKVMLSRTHQQMKLQIPVQREDGTYSVVTQRDIEQSSIRTMVLMKEKLDIIKKLKNYGIAEDQINIYQTIQTDRRNRKSKYKSNSNLTKKYKYVSSHGEKSSSSYDSRASDSQSIQNVSSSIDSSRNYNTYGRSATKSVNNSSILTQYSAHLKELSSMNFNQSKNEGEREVSRKKSSISKEEIQMAKMLFKDAAAPEIRRKNKNKELKNVVDDINKSIQTIHNISTIHKKYTSKNKNDKISADSNILTKKKGKTPKNSKVFDSESKDSENDSDNSPYSSDNLDVSIVKIGKKMNYENSNEKRQRVIINRRNPYVMIDMSSGDEDAVTIPIKQLNKKGKSSKKRGAEKTNKRSIDDNKSKRKQFNKDEPRKTTQKVDNNGKTLAESMLFNIGFHNKQNLKKIDKIDRELNEQYDTGRKDSRKKSENNIHKEIKSDELSESTREISYSSSKDFPTSSIDSSEDSEDSSVSSK